MIIEGIIGAFKLAGTFFIEIATTPGLNVLVLGPAIVGFTVGIFKKKCI